jgi:hypothetical protein
VEPALGPDTGADEIERPEELEPLESLLQQKVEELEERLRQPPGDERGSDPRAPPEPGTSDIFEELLQPDE